MPAIRGELRQWKHFSWPDTSFNHLNDWPTQSMFVFLVARGGLRDACTCIGLLASGLPSSAEDLTWVMAEWTEKHTLRWRHNDHAGVSNHQPPGCLLNRLFRRKSKKTSKLRVTGLCAGNSPGTGEFSAQMASYAENVSIWWRHHERKIRHSLVTSRLFFSKIQSMTGPWEQDMWRFKPVWIKHSEYWYLAVVLLQMASTPHSSRYVQHRVILNPVISIIDCTRSSFHIHETASRGIITRGLYYRAKSLTAQ